MRIWLFHLILLVSLSAKAQLNSKLLTKLDSIAWTVAVDFPEYEKEGIITAAEQNYFYHLCVRKRKTNRKPEDAILPVNRDYGVSVQTFTIQKHGRKRVQEMVVIALVFLIECD